MKGVALYWRRILQRYNMIGTKCENCNEKFFPPRPICPKCRRKSKIVPFKFKGEGEIYSYTIIYAPPEGFELIKPYAVAIVKLDEGPMVLSQVVDCEPEKIKVGTRVKAIFRKVIESSDDGIIQYGYKFRPVQI